MKTSLLALLLTVSTVGFGADGFVLPYEGLLPFNLPWMNHAQKDQVYSSTENPAGIFVVEAYFLNCPYCNDNAPDVDDLSKKYANEPRVHVLDVGVDRSDSQYAEWIKRHQPNHPVLKDAARALIGKLGTSGYPSTYVIDCRGNIKAQTSGAWDNAAKRKIQDAIDELLKQECYL